MTSRATPSPRGRRARLRSSFPPSPRPTSTPSSGPPPTRPPPPPVPATGRALYDYFSIAELHQPCAVLSNSVNSYTAGALPLNNGFANARCNTLKALGYLTSTGPAALADEALGKLHAA